MLPQSFEYFFLLIVFAAATLSVLWDETREVLRRRSFWLAFLGFLVYCTCIELFALSQGWWHFNQAKIIGWSICGIPVEEFSLFLLFFVLTSAAWTKIRR